MKYYIGIDLGGTNIVASVVDERYNILATAQTKTNLPREAELIVGDMAAMARQALADANLTLADITGVGVGCPGTVNRATGVIEYANNLQFYDLPLRDMLSGLLDGKEIFLDNDANAAAYGEFLAGGAKGCTHAVMVTLGTGVGSGIIIDGKIYSGFNFAGAEIGHMVIEAGGRACTCGRKGCFEAYSSASGLIAMTREAMERNADSLMWELADGDLAKVNGKTAFDGMRRGDPAACGVVDEYIRFLATGIANIINIFQPEILCIGGGICKEGETLLKPLREIISNEVYSRFSKQNTKIVKAELGNDAGIIGAAFLCEMKR